ncbi:MAG: ATP-dependent helicase HrpB [Bdellovibrionota bacterium]
MAFPIDSYLPDIAKALTNNPAVLLKAEPGAGKTTQVPRYLLDHFKKILVIEPRRLAAKLSAEWVAEQCGDKVGGLVGYQIRLESRKSAATRLVYVTEGILTRLILQDRTLSEYDLIILDEFHERHVHSDIALTLVKGLQKTRLDLKLLVMSATLEQTLLQTYLGSVPSFDVPGRVFPVSVQYKPFPHETPMMQRVSAAVQDMLVDPGCQGNILVFLAGSGQISQCAAYLDGRLGDVELISLSADQAHNYSKIVSNATRKKVILSTNVAETSLTLPNIQGVIDYGTARILAFAPWSGLPTLEEKKVSQASCIQRSGRAGRVAAGICYRLFSESDFHARAKFTEPEIQRIDLCQIMLELASMSPGRTWDIEHFDWLQRPREATLQQNLDLLKNLGALTGAGQLTADGEEMVKIPLHPRLSRIWLAARTRGVSELGYLAALLINEGSILDKDQRPDEHAYSDVLYQLQVLLDWMKKKPRRVNLDRGAVERIRASFDQAARAHRFRSMSELVFERENDLLFCIFLGFADRVGKYRPLNDTGRRKVRHYNFALGRGAVLHENSSAQTVEWLVAVDARESYDDDLGRIFIASGVHPEFLAEDPFGLLQSVDEVKMDPKAGRARRCQQTLYGKLLVEEKWEESRSADSRDLLLSEIRKQWPEPFADSEALLVYHRKLELMDKAGVTHDLPRFEGEMLDLLIDHVSDGVLSIRELSKKSLNRAIEEQLSYADQHLLSSACPEFISLAAGKKLKVNYHEEAEPFIASKIQDFFLQKDTPTICQGRYPLLLKLLAPSQRPAQITKDLKGFWTGSYHEVKKELKRRYPKQAWPDDPVTFVMPKREPRK